MAYRNLYKPLSQFVDPGSTEVAEALKNKYLAAYQSADATGDALSKLSVADFANDQRMYNDLYNNTRSSLDAIAQRGDYENMFIPVNNLARDYRDAATPLENNYKLYQTDLAEKQKMLQDGKITMADYSNWVQRTKLRMGEDDYQEYGGLQMDKAGRIDNTSYYNPVPIAQYVDIQGEIIDTLNKIPEVKEGGYEVKMIGSAADFEETAGRYPADMQFAITKQGQIVEGIPPNVVAAVTRQVLDRPDVRAYMEQSADFATMNMSPDELDMIIANEIQLLREEDSPEARASAGMLTDLLTTGSPGTKRRAAKMAKFNNGRIDYLGTAMASYQPSHYGGKSITSFEASLTEKLKAANGNNGSWTPKFAGDQREARPTHIANEEGTVTAEKIQENIAALEEESVTINRALLEVVPELAQYEQSTNTTINLNAPMNDLVAKAKMMNPDLNEPATRLAIEQARTKQADNRAEIVASEQLIRNSYGDFAQTVLSDIVSDIAIEFKVPAINLPDHINGLVPQDTYRYDAESNTIDVSPGNGTAESSNAYKLAILNSLMGDLRADRQLEVLMESGIDPEEFAVGLTSAMFGVNQDEAARLVDLASTLNIATPRSNAATAQAAPPVQSTDRTTGERNRGPAPYTRTQPTTRGARYPGRVAPAASQGDPTGRDLFGFIPDFGEVSAQINPIIRGKIQEAKANSAEWLGSKSKVQYTTGITGRPLGDRDGSVSKALTEGLKGQQIGRFANVPLAPGTVDVVDGSVAEDQRIADVVVDPTATIREVAFTTYYDGALRRMMPAMSLSFKGQGSNAEGGTVTVPYDSAVLEYDPRMQSMITNTYDSPGGAMVQQALGTLLSYPGSFTESEGVILNREMFGRQMQYEFIPTVQKLGEDGLDVVAGISFVRVTGSGAGQETTTVDYPVDKFIENYNARIAALESVPSGTVAETETNE